MEKLFKDILVQFSSPQLNEKISNNLIKQRHFQNKVKSSCNCVHFVNMNWDVFFA